MADNKLTTHGQSTDIPLTMPGWPPKSWAQRLRYLGRICQNEKLGRRYKAAADQIDRGLTRSPGWQSVREPK